MVWLIGALMAIFGLGDLFAAHGKRSLPWWGDVIVIGAGAVMVLAAKLLDDD
jgi:hypothetical protein